MSFRRYSSENKRMMNRQVKMVWTPKKMLKAQKRLTRWYFIKLRKEVSQVAWDLWAILVGILTYSMAIWMILIQFLTRR